MTRPLTTTQRDELYAPATATVWLTLLTVEHDDLVAPIRLVDDRAAHNSRGNQYLPWPFSVELPSETDESFPGASLRISVVDRDILTQLRALGSPPTVTIEVIRASAPDTVVAGPWSLDVASAEIGPLEAVLALSHEPILEEPYPGLTYTPEDFPALFSGVGEATS